MPPSTPFPEICTKMSFMQTTPTSRFWPAAFYFLYFGAGSALYPYQALYFQSIGLGDSQIGLLLALPPLIGLFASPFWTGIADTRHRHMTILTINIVMVTVLIAMVPAAMNLTVIFALMISYAFFTAPINALVDSATMSMLAGQREMYGRVRMWGAVGWGLMAPFAGEVLNRFGLRWAFWVYAGLFFISLFVARRLTFNRVSTVQQSFTSGIKQLLSDRHWLVFLGVVMMAGIGLASVNNYLFLLMNELGASETLMGFSLTISTLSEIPVMFFGNLLLKRLGSKGLIALAMGIIGLRSILFFFATAPLMVILIQLMHGLTFPALWLAGVKYAADNAPPGLDATAQGLLGMMMWGIGTALGGLLGGLLNETVGVSGMFATTGAIVLAALLVFLLLEKNGSKEPATNSL